MCMQGKTTVERFWSYIFDLNYGLFSYFSVIVSGAMILLIIAVVHRHWRYLGWMSALVIMIMLYSIMTNINSGMAGISRCNSWGSVILIFAVCLFYSKRQVLGYPNTTTLTSRNDARVASVLL